MIKKILPALCLLALSHTATAGVIVDTDIKVDENGYRIFNWLAECSDCDSTKGDTSFTDSVSVRGNITLDGFVFGQEFTFDESNLVSFQYNGPSKHVDNLVMHNANFSASDAWVDDSDRINSSLPSGVDIFTAPGITLNPGAVIDGFTNFAENMDVTGWLSADLLSYSLDLTFDTFVPIDIVTGEYIKFSELDGASTTYKKQTFHILYESNGNWEIIIDGISADLGRGATLVSSAISVPEPSTAAILGLGLLGLVGFGSKKHSFKL